MAQTHEELFGEKLIKIANQDGQRGMHPVQREYEIIMAQIDNFRRRMGGEKNMSDFILNLKEEMNKRKSE